MKATHFRLYLKKFMMHFAIKEIIALLGIIMLGIFSYAQPQDPPSRSPKVDKDTCIDLPFTWGGYATIATCYRNSRYNEFPEDILEQGMIYVLPRSTAFGFKDKLMLYNIKKALSKKLPLEIEMVEEKEAQQGDFQRTHRYQLRLYKDSELQVRYTYLPKTTPYAPNIPIRSRAQTVYHYYFVIDDLTTGERYWPTREKSYFLEIGGDFVRLLKRLD